MSAEASHDRARLRRLGGAGPAARRAGDFERPAHDGASAPLPRDRRRGRRARAWLDPGVPRSHGQRERGAVVGAAGRAGQAARHVAPRDRGRQPAGQLLRLDRPPGMGRGPRRSLPRAHARRPGSGPRPAAGAPRRPPDRAGDGRVAGGNGRARMGPPVARTGGSPGRVRRAGRDHGAVDRVEHRPADGHRGRSRLVRRPLSGGRRVRPPGSPPHVRWR